MQASTIWKEPETIVLNAPFGDAKLSCVSGNVWLRLRVDGKFAGSEQMLAEAKNGKRAIKATRESIKVI